MKQHQEGRAPTNGTNVPTFAFKRQGNSFIRPLFFSAEKSAKCPKMSAYTFFFIASEKSKNASMTKLTKLNL